MHSVASVFTRVATILGQQLSDNENNYMVLLLKIAFFGFQFQIVLIGERERAKNCHKKMILSALLTQVT